MSEEIFRKKSIERIKSPEELDDYVRVSNPGVWLMLAAVSALLIGTCIWASLGTIDTVVKGEAVVLGGNVTCYIDEKDVNEVELGMPANVGDAKGIVKGIENFSDRADTCRVIIEADIPDGQYDAEIVTESIKPMSFIFN